MPVEEDVVRLMASIPGLSEQEASRVLEEAHGDAGAAVVAIGDAGGLDSWRGGEQQPGGQQPHSTTMGVDDFRVLRLLGKGSSGKAELVESIATNKRYAMKTIEGIFDEDQGVMLNEETKKEVEILSRIRHPNVIAYHASFMVDTTVYIIMGYADGGTLENVVKKARQQGSVTLPEELVMGWAVQMALAVSHIHTLHVLHRDIKLANVLLTSDGQIKVGDFGLARTLENTAQLAQTACGTPYYISPELCHGMPYGKASDVWAIGCALYELLTLKRPFDGKNLHSVVLTICQKEPPPIKRNYSQQAQEMVVNRMLQKDPDQRITLSGVLELPFLSVLVVKFKDVVTHYVEDFSPEFAQVVQWNSTEAVVEEIPLVKEEIFSIIEEELSSPVSPNSAEKRRSSHLPGPFRACMPLMEIVPETAKPAEEKEAAVSSAEGQASEVFSPTAHEDAQALLESYPMAGEIVKMIVSDDYEVTADIYALSCYLAQACDLHSRSYLCSYPTPCCRSS